MAPSFKPVEPFDIVVFGGTGDLALRKLLPGLYHRDLDGQLEPQVRIFGAARGNLDRGSYQAMVRDALRQFVREADLERAKVDAFIERLHFVRVDAAGEDGWEELRAALEEGTPNEIRVFYLAVGPGLFGTICKKIAEHGLRTAGTRVVIEKPLGTDFASAQAINDAVGEHFEEHQIFRIDHYLGKESVQNLVVLRFANRLFEPIWNATAIDHVQITVAEELGAGERAGYYDQSGATRDMVQNHILQMLCLVAMEPPASLDADALRDEKLKVLRSLRPIVGGDVRSKTVRGQYRAGAIDGKPVPGYLEELNGHASTTETFVVVKAEVENWRWNGVPFYLRTGKRLPSRHSEIVIQFKAVPHSIFGEASGGLTANRLVLRLQPDESVKLFMTIKDPGPGGLRLRDVPLNLSFAETFHIRYPDAYERLLMDVVRGNASLFMRKDEVAAAWRWIDPIRQGWEEFNMTPKLYAAGSWGPTDATALIARDGRNWYEDAL